MQLINTTYKTSMIKRLVFVDEDLTMLQKLQILIEKHISLK